LRAYSAGKLLSFLRNIYLPLF